MARGSRSTSCPPRRSGTAWRPQAASCSSMGTSFAWGGVRRTRSAYEFNCTARTRSSKIGLDNSQLCVFQSEMPILMLACINRTQARRQTSRKIRSHPPAIIASLPFKHYCKILRGSYLKSPFPWVEECPYSSTYSWSSRRKALSFRHALFSLFLFSFDWRVSQYSAL